MAGYFIHFYSALPQKMRLGSSVCLDLAQLAPGYFHALINHHNSGKPKGKNYFG